MGLRNLALHGLRSALTALGIVLGVAAVIMMVSINEGKMRATLGDIERLGARNIIIRSQPPANEVQQQSGKETSFVNKYGITRDDVTALTAVFPEAEAIVPVKEVGAQVLNRDRARTSQAYGTTPKLLDLAKLRVARGRYLVESDLEERANVAVLGAEVARLLYPNEDPLECEVRIDGTSFRVVGVLAPVGISGGAGGALIGRDLNLDVHIPITTARVVFDDLIVRRDSGNIQAREVQISEVYIASPSRERVPTDAALATRFLEQRHPGMKDVTIVVPYELLANAQREARNSTLITVTVAGIALLVGGIGIMNIMLATVTERIREIGIRRAVGATRRAISLQFLIETTVLSALGGIVGVLLGVGASVAARPFVRWLPNAPFVGHLFSESGELHTALSFWPIGVSFSVALATGLVFGIYPALRAAKQDPIVALRHD
ncbi:MAG: ABC transporter permease [Phycisphaerales bacterium]|nr:ABC transporter permease [Phycisphaerales bacterium]